MYSTEHGKGPLTFASFFPYLKRKWVFSEADQAGSFVTHQDLLLASLQTPLVRNAVLFAELSHPGAAPPEVAFERIRHAIAELSHQVSSRITVESVSWLRSTEARRSPLVFVGKFSEFTQLAQLRRASQANWPISALVHSVLVPNLSAACLNVIVHAEPQDRIVVSSLAGEIAITSALRQAGMMLSHRFALDTDVALPRLVRIPPGIDTAAFHGLSRPHARSMLGLPKDTLLVLYLGRLSEDYKADLLPLLNACRRLNQEFPQLRLLVAGSTVMSQYAAKLASIAREFGSTPWIDFLTDFPRFLKPSLYAAADVFVSPVDNVQETFGLTIIEAMASGLPVIASDWSGYRELIRDGVDGFLIPTSLAEEDLVTASMIAACSVPPYTESYLARRTVVDTDALYRSLATLLRSPEMRQNFGSAGRMKVVEQYSWPLIAQRFAESWQGQLAEASEHYSVKPYLRLDEIFRHYPSKKSNVTHLRLLSCRPDHLNDVLRVFGPGSRHAMIARACVEKPQPLWQILLTGEPAERSAILELLKSGLVGTIETKAAV